MIYNKRYDLVLAIFKWTVSVLLFILLFANNLFFKQMSSRIIQKVTVFVATPVVIYWYHFWRTILIIFWYDFLWFYFQFSYHIGIFLEYIRKILMFKKEWYFRKSLKFELIVKYITLFRARPFFLSHSKWPANWQPTRNLVNHNSQYLKSKNWACKTITRLEVYLRLYSINFKSTFVWQHTMLQRLYF